MTPDNTPTPQAGEKLVKRLQIMSGMLTMGERIAFGSDASLMDEAATAILALQSQLEEAAEFELLANRLQDALETAESEVVKLRAALEPFAAVAANDVDDDAKDQWDIWNSPAGMNVTVGDLRAARAALGKGGE